MRLDSREGESRLFMYDFRGPILSPALLGGFPSATWIVRCKDSGLEKGSKIEAEERIDAAVERRREDMGEGDSVEISNWASRLAPHTASEGPVKIGGVSGLWARPGGLAACGKRGR